MEQGDGLNFYVTSKGPTIAAMLHSGSHVRWWCCSGLRDRYSDKGLSAIVTTAVHHTTECTPAIDTAGGPHSAAHDTPLGISLNRSRTKNASWVVLLHEVPPPPAVVSSCSLASRPTTRKLSEQGASLQ
jgi:hypothetical protein